MLILLINLLILSIIVVDLVDMLVDTASLPQDMTPADLTTMLLLVINVMFQVMVSGKIFEEV